MGSVTGRDRTVLAVVVVVAVLALAGLLVWRGEDLGAFWAFLGD